MVEPLSSGRWWPRACPPAGQPADRRVAAASDTLPMPKSSRLRLARPDIHAVSPRRRMGFTGYPA